MLSLLVAGAGFLISRPLVLSALRGTRQECNDGKGGSVGKELDVPLEPVPVEELLCRFHSGAWAAAAPAAELSPKLRGGLLLGKHPAACSMQPVRGHLGKCTFPSACWFAFLMGANSAGY